MKFTEEALEQAVIELFETENYQHKNGMYIHKEMSDVLLRDDIRAFLHNRYSSDDITVNEIKSIIHQMDVLPSSALYDSNKAIIKMISDGFVFKREDRSKKDLFIQLLDFDVLENNLFKIVNQLEIQGYEKRIPDGIVYVNGLPLVVLEFKSAIKENTTIKDAFTQLTVRYRRDIPELFKYNALCIISDGVNNKSGSLFAPYDFFYAWRKIEGSEPLDKDGIDSLFTMVKGLFNQRRLLDVVRHFVYFPDTSTKEEKIVPRYPQYYAANKLFESIKRNMKPHGTGKGGTYFGATGCGKSFTMLYLTRLLMRSVHFQSPTIVLITDRTDLDDQLSGQFTNAKGFIGDDQVISVESRADLKTYLQSRKSGGVFLTTIHKFNEDTDMLTERTNVICISDEAHRSQINLDQKIKITKDGVEKKYGFAKHLHDSLPNATYVGFTGTPIDATMAVFGEVEDSYTMRESVYEGLVLTEKERQEIKPIEKIKMVMTRDQDDVKELYDLLGTKDYRKELDRQYKGEKSNFKIAIVVDMWTTGFDVPFLDAIYIDKPIQQHSLIQTISRVNRVYEGKEMGLVVDYIGIKSNMNVALKKYGVVDGDNFDGTDKAVVIVKDQLDLLARLFHKFDSTAYFKGTPLQQLHCLNQAAEFAQQTDEFEKRFMAIVKKLRSAYTLCCNSEDISQIEKDNIHLYFTIKSIIHKLTVGVAPDTAQMNEKVRQMIQEALISEGVEEIFKLDKNDPKNNADLFSDEYMAKIDKIKLPNIKIKLLQKLLARAIDEFKKTNRIQGVDFSKRLKKLIELYNERKDFQAMQSDVLDDIADQFADLFAELVKERNSFKDLGIDFEEKAFYDILKAIAEKYKFEYAHDKLIKLSREIKKIIDDKARYTDWSHRDDIRAELKAV